MAWLRTVYVRLVTEAALEDYGIHDQFVDLCELFDHPIWICCKAGYRLSIHTVSHACLI